MFNLQNRIDGWAAVEQRNRAETQMTLGEAIDRLSSLPPSLKIKGLGELHSYRGYYSDLAFSPDGKDIIAEELLEQCRSAMGEVFTGYKGGEYQMGKLTPLWVAPYGDCGEKLIAINNDGTITTQADDD